MARVIAINPPPKRRVPLRLRVTQCETCLDKGRVSRLRPGPPSTEPCPDCSEGSW